MPLQPQGPPLRAPAPEAAGAPRFTLKPPWDGSRYVIEEGRRLSQSVLWDLQRHYYGRRGVDAWAKSEVPLFVTSNATIAKQYADLVFAAMQDIRAQANGDRRPIILELGAGSGRFAFHFLRALTDACENAKMPPDAFLYVMSDVSESTIASWEAHPQLQTYFDSGVLDTAYVDIARIGAITLRRSRETIAAGSLSVPLIAIANYVFDSVPQELFYVEGGGLHECAIRLVSDADPAELDPARVLDAITCEVEIGALVEQPYDDSRWNDLLSPYRSSGGGYASFPVTALRCIESLHAFSPHGAVIIAADKGDHQLFTLKQFTPARHGSISLDVDFQALARHAASFGGLAIFPQYPHATIDVGVLLLVENPDAYSALIKAYGSIAVFGPDEFLGICSHAKRTAAAMSARTVAAYLRLSRYDSELLARLLPSLVQNAGKLDHEEKELITGVIDRCWQSHFTLGTEGSLAFDLGVFFYEIDDGARALEFFASSARVAGIHAGTMFNTALCAGRLGDTDQEHALLQQLVQWFPDYLPAARRLAHITMGRP